MYYCIAEVTLKAGQRAAALQLLEPFVTEVRQEEGCLEYTALLDIPSDGEHLPAERTDVVTMLERWETMETFMKHNASAEFQAFQAAMADHIERVDVRVMRRGI